MPASIRLFPLDALSCRRYDRGVPPEGVDTDPSPPLTADPVTSAERAEPKTSPSILDVTRKHPALTDDKLESLLLREINEGFAAHKEHTDASVAGLHDRIRSAADAALKDHEATRRHVGRLSIMVRALWIRVYGVEPPTPDGRESKKDLVSADGGEGGGEGTFALSVGESEPVLDLFAAELDHRIRTAEASDKPLSKRVRDHEDALGSAHILHLHVYRLTLGIGMLVAFTLLLLLYVASRLA